MNSRMLPEGKVTLSRITGATRSYGKISYEPSSLSATGRVARVVAWNSGYGIADVAGHPVNCAIGSKVTDMRVTVRSTRPARRCCHPAALEPAARELEEPRVPLRRGLDPRRIGIDGPPGPGPAPGLEHRRPARARPRSGRGTRSRARRPRGPRCTRPGARCSRRAPAPTRRPASRHRSRRSGAAARRARRGPRRSSAGRRTPTPRTRRGATRPVVREVEVGEHRPPVGVVQRHPLAARVRRPHRDALRVRGSPGTRSRSDAVAQFTNSPPALLGPPARKLAGRGVRDDPVARHRRRRTSSPCSR